MNPRSLFIRKLTTDPAEVEGHGSGLKKSLTALDLTMLGIGAIIGAGLFSSVRTMISGSFEPDGVTVKLFGAGPAVMASFLLTAIACGFAALCYAEIAAMTPVSGSAYSYSYAAFGELIAWIIGWDLIIEYAIGNVFVAQSWADYFQSFLLGINDHWKIPLWLMKDVQSAGAAVAADPSLASQFPTLFGHPIAFHLPAFAITILLTVLLYLGVRESARANTIMVVLKLVLVVAFIVVGAWSMLHGATNHWTPFAPNGFKGIWQGAALGFFAYIGFDAVSTAGEETRNPQKDMPRGLIGSLLICTVLYVVTGAVITAVVPWDDPTFRKENDPIAFVMKAIGYPSLATTLAFGAMAAMTSVLLVFQYGQTRIFMVMARDGLLPAQFAKVHAKHKTPHWSTWVTGLMVAFACSLMTPDQAAGLTNIGTLFAFILVSIGVIVLRRRVPDQHRPFKVPLYPVTPILSALACLGLICGLERSNWLRLIIWLQIGLVVYVAFGFRNSRLRRASGPAATSLARPAGVTLVGWTLVLLALFLDGLIVWYGTPVVENDTLKTELFTGYYGLRTMALEVIGLALLLGMTWARKWYLVVPPIIIFANAWLERGWFGAEAKWSLVVACAAAYVVGAVVLRRRGSVLIAPRP